MGRQHNVYKYPEGKPTFPSIRKLKGEMEQNNTKYINAIVYAQPPDKPNLRLRGSSNDYLK